MHPISPASQLQAALNETDDPWALLAEALVLCFEHRLTRGVSEDRAYLFASQSISRFLDRIGAPTPVSECTWTNFTSKSNEIQLDKAISRIYYDGAAHRGLM